jgi:hypothetical protein
MTIEEVKRDLPDVQIAVSKNKVVWAKLSGRMCEDCTVTVFNSTKNAREPWKDWHFAWGTVAHCITSGVPLRGY